jgi:hypothetical protein
MIDDRRRRGQRDQNYATKGPDMTSDYQRAAEAVAATNVRRCAPANLRAELDQRR